MATIIKFDIKELKRLAKDEHSCVYEKKITQVTAIQPWCLGNVEEAIKNKLDYKIGKYDNDLNGILLSYKNLRVLTNVGTIRNDNADINFQVQADHFIFRPVVGALLRGIVNKKCHTHLAVLVHRVFNVVIPRPTEEPGNRWIGESIQEGQHVLFRVMVLDLYGSLPYIRGELDERSLEGDEQNEDLNVTYVNFDKIKPQLPRCTSSPDSETEHVKLNGKKEKITESKIKAKRQSRLDTETKELAPKSKKQMKSIY